MARSHKAHLHLTHDRAVHRAMLAFFVFLELVSSNGVEHCRLNEESEKASSPTGSSLQAPIFFIGGSLVISSRHARGWYYVRYMLYSTIASRYRSSLLSRRGSGYLPSRRLISLLTCALSGRMFDFGTSGWSRGFYVLLEVSPSFYSNLLSVLLQSLMLLYCSSPVPSCRACS